MRVTTEQLTAFLTLAQEKRFVTAAPQAGNVAVRAQPPGTVAGAGARDTAPGPDAPGGGADRERRAVPGPRPAGARCAPARGERAGGAHPQRQRAGGAGDPAHRRAPTSSPSCSPGSTSCTPRCGCGWWRRPPSSWRTGWPRGELDSGGAEPPRASGGPGAAEAVERGLRPGGAPWPSTGAGEEAGGAAGGAARAAGGDPRRCRHPGAGGRGRGGGRAGSTSCWRPTIRSRCAAWWSADWAWRSCRR